MKIVLPPPTQTVLHYVPAPEPEPGILFQEVEFVPGRDCRPILITECRYWFIEQGLRFPVVERVWVKDMDVLSHWDHYIDIPDDIADQFTLRWL